MLRGNREHTLVLLVGSRSVLQRHIATAWEALDKETVAGAEPSHVRMSPIRKEPGIAAFKEGEVQVAGKVALGEEAELEVIVEEAENLLRVDPATKGLMQLKADLPAEQRLRDGAVGQKTTDSDTGRSEGAMHKLGMSVQGMPSGQHAKRRTTILHVHGAVRQSLANQGIGSLRLIQVHLNDVPAEVRRMACWSANNLGAKAQLYNADDLRARRVRGELRLERLDESNVDLRPRRCSRRSDIRRSPAGSNDRI